MIYIGGNNQTFEFDFGTKVAGSTKECPMKCYFSQAKTILTPSKENINKQDALVGWWEASSQDQIDKIKTQNNIPLCPTSNNDNGRYAQILIELDINPLANNLFGGSNDALRNALKDIKIDTCAAGFGSKNNKETHSVITTLYDNNAQRWWKTSTAQYGGADMWNINESSDLRMYSFHSSPERGGDCIQSITKDNKIYILIFSQHPSDAKTTSKVLLDYVNIKITLSRKQDNISSIPINMTDRGSILVRFCPDFSCEQEYHTVFDINDGTWDNRFACHFGKIEKNAMSIFSVKNKKLLYTAHFSDAGKDNLIYSEKNPYVKYKIVSILLSWDKEKSKVYRSLLYNNHTSYREVISSDTLTGDLMLSLGQLLGNTNPLNGFIENFQYMPNKVWSKEEAEQILKGKHKYFVMPNISKLEDFLDIYSVGCMELKYDSHKLILTNKVEGWSNAMSRLYNVLPNNTYEFKALYDNHFVGAPHVTFYNSNKQLINSTILTVTGIFNTTKDTSFVQFSLYPGQHKGNIVMIDKVKLSLVP